MDLQDFERLFSAQRLAPYLRHCGHNQAKAKALYVHNLRVCQAMYLPLSTLEVALRNAVDRQMQVRFDRIDWFHALQEHLVLGDLWNKPNQFIQEHKRKHRGQVPDHGQVVAEMTFGYWSKLFQPRYDLELWTQLRHAFPNLGKRARQPRTVENMLRPLVLVRNRAYHYECICWDFRALKANHQRIHRAVRWIDKDLRRWLVENDPFPAACRQAEYHLKQAFNS